MKRKSGAGFLSLIAIVGAALMNFFATALQAQIAPSYVTVVDPREHSFSASVPQGWQVYGGLFRYGYVDARSLIDMTSPDRLTNIRIGDATIPPYTTPGPLAYGSKTPVAPYATGEEFAKRYGQSRFASMCQSLFLKGSRPMPPKYHTLGAQGAGSLRTTGGEAYFGCSLNGRKMLGYVYSETFLVGSTPGNSKWFVVALGSFLSPLAEAKSVGVILGHVAASIAVNPVWAAEQKRRTDQATAVMLGVARANAQATEDMNRRQAQINAQSRAENENFNDILNGVTYTRNTVTGETRTVPSGTGGTLWTNGNRAVVESAMQPGPGFQQLQTISH